MNWSLRLGRVRGIELFVHWTLLIVMGWIAGLLIFAGQTLLTAVLGVGFLLSIFACVVLHEFGHAFMAERYGIRTVDITLLPIGGIARLERLPDDPREELKIALAGPAVNVAIAAALLLSSKLLQALSPSAEVVAISVRLVSDLMWINIGLAAFNMLPAFPLDGGRALRSFLALHLDHAEATQFAATLGKAFAILIGLVGLFSSWWLLFVALFVYFGADHEAHQVVTRVAPRELVAQREIVIRNAMLTQFHVLTRHDTLEMAANEWFDCLQPDFPVMDHGRLVGVLDSDHLIKALAESGPEEHVGNVMERDWSAVEDSDALETAFEKLREDGHVSLPVMHDGRLVGVVTMQSIGQWMRRQSVADESASFSHDLTWRSH